MVNNNIKKLLSEITEIAYEINELRDDLTTHINSYGNCKAITLTVYNGGFTMNDIVFSEMVYWDCKNSEYDLKVLIDKLKGMIKVGK